jgi:uncharacterized membrane protein
MSTKALLAAFAGSVLAFLLGWLIYGIVLMDYFESNTTHYEGLMKEMPNIFLIYINNLLWTLLLAFIFDKWAKIKSFGGGLKAGIIIGLPVSLSFDLYILGGMNLFTPTLVIIDVLASTVITAVAGGLIGFILGTGKKAATQ